MTKVKNQPRKQKQSAAHTPSRAQTHDKAMLADMKAGQQTAGMEPMDASGDMPMRHSRKKEKRFGHN
ncbi:hypothetical protein [Streptacidiphilus neutrinimicus]|uniref:hypothetical protein n=1 Tax=Streptacidiphilus neutrinimicus TaxID=105420 RepID=UPI0005AAA5D6|nr:hypothetical protein [Streptacidiphilus neutrinimicus]